MSVSTRPISEHFSVFLRTGRLGDLAAAIRLIIRQRRLLEASYGALCYITARPGSVLKIAGPDLEVLLSRTRGILESMRAQREQVLRDFALNSPEVDPPTHCLIHGFAITDDGYIIGQYVEGAARIYVRSDGTCLCHDPYKGDRGVRHIHSVFKYNNTVLISTGDAHRYLDEYVTESGRLKMKRRVVRLLGGFTAGCTVNGHLLLGTDFSERPNYVLCFDTGKKFWFPRPAFNQQCALMVAIDDRYVVCFNLTTHCFGDRKTVSVFDTGTMEFVCCAPYADDDLYPN